MKSLPAAVSVLLTVLCFWGCDQMAEQPSYRSYEPNRHFADGLTIRPTPEGVVAYGQPDEMPPWPEPTTATLARGDDQFEVFCAPCHGAGGHGDGIVVRRGFPSPPSFHSDRLRAVSNDDIYAVITHGFGVMFPYGNRVAPSDRQAIVYYIRALQLAEDPSKATFTRAASGKGGT